MAFEDNFEENNYEEDNEPHVGSGRLMSSSYQSRGGQKHLRRASSGEAFDTMDEDDKDGFDIQSLSVVEAEFMYDQADESVGSGVSNSTASTQSSGTDVTSSASSAPKKTINLDAFNIIKVIGKGFISFGYYDSSSTDNNLVLGSFGKVFLVRLKSRGTIHAMKVLKKDHIIKKNQVEHTKTERSVLGYIRHPFIVGLTMAFQTTDKLFFVLDYCAGGELFFHLGKTGRFTEERSKFYAAQITLALEYVHQLNIVYR